MQYEAVIGIEVHAQLLTGSKLFCGCSTRFGASPNSHTCPVCLGLPGVLPTANRKAVDYVIKTALALNCRVAPASRFARKNYYYPDLPKAYQISQYELPIGEGGWLEIEIGGRNKRIGITRVHLEEDAGKLVHGTGGESMVDLNRAGTPLMEIVSEPDIGSAAEAQAYLTALRQLVMYLGVCDGNMEEGSLRCEPNISIRPVGAAELGTKTELKNINSFKAVFKGVEYEIERQQQVLEEGGALVQATFRWDDDAGVTRLMRTKEHAPDYRYFPDPDLVEIAIDDEWRDRLAAELPELPRVRCARFRSEFGLSDYDAGVLTAEKELADYYEDTVGRGAEPKSAANWVMNELLARLRETGTPVGEAGLTPDRLAALLKLVADGTISGKIAKEVFAEAFDSGRDPGEIVESRGLTQVSDADELEAAARRVMAENPGPVREFVGGKEKAVGFLVGQVMKLTRGRANPQMVNSILRNLMKPEQ